MKTPKSKKLRLVEISWIDAEGHSGWSEDNPNEPDVILKTYGLLVRRDKKWIVHADTYDPQGKTWSGRGKIPAGMVKKVRTITTVEI